ncbi:MAG: hypothetical protein OXR67_11950 [Chloroflexota bacterium]|nr:hypothetical protein [Chloroflexota bacterium]
MDQLDFFLRQVTRQQPEGHVVGPGVELDGDRPVAQGSRVIVGRIFPYQDGLAGYR